jgi:hypothetical protein
MEPLSSGSESEESTGHQDFITQYNEVNDWMVEDDEIDDRPVMLEATGSLGSSDSNSDVPMEVLDHSDNLPYPVFCDEDFDNDLFLTLEICEPTPLMQIYSCYNSHKNRPLYSHRARLR